MATVLKKRRFTIKEYYQMAEAGILTERDRVELIEGEVVEMMPIGVRHAGTVNRLASALWGALREQAVVSVQNPVRIAALNSEPQPDVAVLRPRPDFYASAHPEPEDVFLIVEVMDTSTEYDRRVKVPLYARAGIREVWLVDLTTDTVEVLRHPAGDRYQDVRTRRRDDSLTVEALPDLSLPVTDIIG